MAEKEKTALIVWLIVILASILAVFAVPINHVKEALVVTVLINFLAAALFFKVTR